MIFGGESPYARQISEVVNGNGTCGLQRIKNIELPESFILGGCSVIKEDEKEFVILCFAERHRKSCYR